MIDPNRRLLAALIVAAFAAVSGCVSTEVGDPCLPGRPTAVGPSGSCGGGGCFARNEVYLETRSLQCRTRVCMAYHWDERAAPAEQNTRSFCTCRCDGEGDPANLCRCPEGFSCQPVFDRQLGERGLSGSYCVRDGLAPR